MIVENPKEYVKKKKLLGLTVNLARSQDTKSTYKNQLCFYILARNTWKNIKCNKVIRILKSNKMIPFIIKQPEYSCSRLCTQDHQTSLTEIRDVNKWVERPCLRTEVLNIV